MSNTAVVSGDVKGDITSCKIENQVVKVERNGALSPSQTTSYIAYDVCNKNTIESYKVQELTGFGTGLIWLAGIVIVVMAIGIANRISGY